MEYQRDYLPAGFTSTIYRSGAMVGDNVRKAYIGISLTVSGQEGKGK